MASTFNVPEPMPLTQTYFIKCWLSVLRSNLGLLDFPVHFVTFMLSYLKISLLISLFCCLMTATTARISSSNDVHIISKVVYERYILYYTLV